MIGKHHKRTAFTPVLQYVTGKPGATYIGGNMEGQSVPELVAEFQCARNLNLKIKHPAYHIALSSPPHEKLDENTWEAIACAYMEGMGYRQCQWVAFRHVERDHDHIHIIASRIQLTDGKVVRDSWDYHKSQSLLRQIEQQYDLTPVVSSWEVGKRSIQRGEREKLNRTNQPSVRQELQALLDQAIDESQTMPQLVDWLQHQGVEVKIQPTPKGDMGISYQRNNVPFAGSQLGRDYTFKGLQKRRGISYESDRDEDYLNDLLESPPMKLTLDEMDEIFGIADRLMDWKKRGKQVLPDKWCYQFDHYVVTYQKDEMCFQLHDINGRGELARSFLSPNQAPTCQQVRSITPQDLEAFREHYRRVWQEMQKVQKQRQKQRSAQMER